MAIFIDPRIPVTSKLVKRWGEVAGILDQLMYLKIIDKFTNQTIIKHYQ
jgi:hypothetical protein